MTDEEADALAEVYAEWFTALEKKAVERGDMAAYATAQAIGDLADRAESMPELVETTSSRLRALAIQLGQLQ